MKDKIDLSRFREVVGSNHTESQLESIRNGFYNLAEFFVEKILDMRKIQTISCRATIVKLIINRKQ